MSEDTYWNPGNMIYGDNPVKWNERETSPDDPLGLNTYTYKPDITAIMQSGNLYAYCMSNPVKLTDPSGNIAGEAVLVATNWWNPIGWIAAGLIIVEAIIIITIADNVSSAKKTAPPSKLKEGDKVKTPDTHPGEFTKNSDGSYTHDKTGWNFKKDPSRHGGDHYDAKPPGAKTGNYQNVYPDGTVR